MIWIFLLLEFTFFFYFQGNWNLENSKNNYIFENFTSNSPDFTIYNASYSSPSLKTYWFNWNLLWSVYRKSVFTALYDHLLNIFIVAKNSTCWYNFFCSTSSIYSEIKTTKFFTYLKSIRNFSCPKQRNMILPCILWLQPLVFSPSRPILRKKLPRLKLWFQLMKLPLFLQSLHFSLLLLLLEYSPIRLLSLAILHKKWFRQCLFRKFWQEKTKFLKNLVRK